MSLPKFGFFDSKVRVFTEEWSYENKDGSIGKFVMPADINIPLGEPVTIYATLPDDIK